MHSLHMLFDHFDAEACKFVRRASFATCAPPGSVQKVELMAHRVAVGESMFHEKDTAASTASNGACLRSSFKST